MNAPLRYTLDVTTTRGIVHVGDCLAWLRSLPDESVDAVVTDPPYGLGKEPDPREVLTAWLSGEAFTPGGAGFMGRAWDAFVPSPCVWQECLRVLKPGGHLLAFAGTRTYDWIVLGVRLAGFEVRDMLSWVYSTGFPKSLDVSKAIDKAAGVEREVIGPDPQAARRNRNTPQFGGPSMNTYAPPAEMARDRMMKTKPATPEAAQWSGWGTALKPAVEPIVMARKPLRGTVASNVLEYGAGGVNVDGCRVASSADDIEEMRGRSGVGRGDMFSSFGRDSGTFEPNATGRWPANLLHDGSDEVVGLFPQTGPASGRVRNNAAYRGASKGADKAHMTAGHEDSGGSAARFFYCAKATRREREAGLDHLPRGIVDPTRAEDSAGRENPRAGAGRKGGNRANVHPTVKPLALMRWLVRLVTPPGGLVIDPYTGSGTTGVAAVCEGMHFAGAELDTWHGVLAHERIAYAMGHGPSGFEDVAEGGEDDDTGADVVPMQAALPLGG